ncbi:hypothetical protein V6N12_068049 [Hibiscus sabdariffa]|uniref:Uncharacterized protein n=1 Tax=Hibiscus sabdariffa TaxID=183260 RepID=A0ABR2FPB6_9ROSI
MIGSLRSFMGPVMLMKNKCSGNPSPHLGPTVQKNGVIGDSNMVTRPEKKLGRAIFDVSSAKWFCDFMDAYCLLELPLKGDTFTWSNHMSEDEAILEKLDRILISLE